MDSDTGLSAFVLCWPQKFLMYLGSAQVWISTLSQHFQNYREKPRFQILTYFWISDDFRSVYVNIYVHCARLRFPLKKKKNSLIPGLIDSYRVICFLRTSQLVSIVSITFCGWCSANPLISYPEYINYAAPILYCN
jgi:hypothetical protein